MNFEVQDQGVDKLAIAEQAIVSAGNILAAAGFRREEIASFFRQAAEQLEGGGIGTARETNAASSPRLDALRREFLAIPPVRELEMLQSRAIELMQGTPLPEELFELAMALVPHVGAAQDWLRSMAEEARLAIVVSRGNEPHEPGAEQIFLEDFEAPYHASFALIATTFSELGRQGHDNAFRKLLIALVEHNVTVTPGLKDTIETWINVAS